MIRRQTLGIPYFLLLPALLAPGIGIAQLARHDGIDAVLVTPWRWDGRERRSLPRPEPYVPDAPAGTEQKDDAANQEPLFA